jgi:HEAT repeat protein
LGRIGDARAVEPLTEKLSDKDMEVRLFARYALDEIDNAGKRQAEDASRLFDKSLES